jgi:hypothetical protein
VIGLIALNFVLGIVLAGVMSITLVIQIFSVHFHNLAANSASLRVPDYAIADFDFVSSFPWQSRFAVGLRRQFVNSRWPHTFPSGPQRTRDEDCSSPPAVG